MVLLFLVFWLMIGVVLGIIWCGLLISWWCKLIIWVFVINLDLVRNYKNGLVSYCGFINYLGFGSNLRFLVKKKVIY